MSCITNFNDGDLPLSTFYRVPFYPCPSHDTCKEGKNKALMSFFKIIFQESNLLVGFLEYFEKWHQANKEYHFAKALMSSYLWTWLITAARMERGFTWIRKFHKRNYFSVWCSENHCPLLSGAKTWTPSLATFIHPPCTRQPPMTNTSKALVTIIIS